VDQMSEKGLASLSRLTQLTRLECRTLKTLPQRQRKVGRRCSGPATFWRTSVQWFLP
jgi:hypothetical protein